MYLAVFLPSLSGGGAERVILQVANKIAERGHRVDMVLASATGAYIGEVSDCVNIIDFKSSKVSLSLLQMRSYIKDSSPEVMLSALPHANLVALMSVMLSKVKPRLIISERNTIGIHSIKSQGIKGNLMRYLMRLLYPRSDAIIAVSDGVARSLSEYINISRDSVSIIPNPCNIDRIRCLSNEMINESWFDLNDLPIVVGVGRLTEQKDFSLLIRSFSLALREVEARLLILGEGELRGELEDLAAGLGLNRENFFMPGFKDNPFKYLKRSNVFVLSSKWEGFPNVILQALGCGCSVISTNCQSGPSEILDDGKWGDLVPVGDLEMLSKSIVFRLQNRNRINVESRCAFFDIDGIVDKYIKVISN